MTTPAIPSAWKSASLVEPPVSVTTTRAGDTMSVLPAGLVVDLQGRSAPLIATRVAALVAQLAAPATPPGRRVVRYTVRGSTRASGTASASVVIVASGRPVVVDPQIVATDGEWVAELEVPLPDGAQGVYPFAVLLVGSRSTPDDVLLASVDTLDLALAAAAPPADDDPAAPASRGEHGEDPEGADARAANFGVAADADAEAADVSFDLAPASLVLDMAAAQAFLQACMTSTPRVEYGLGAKLPRHDAVPGTEFRKVDCSGFVRELVWRATTPHLNFPDGSVVQHEWVQKHALPKETPAAAMATDGVVRIAFLRPEDSPKKIGHVVIVHNGRTLESHGGVGPNSRPWTATDWQAKARVYRLP